MTTTCRTCGVEWDGAVGPSGHTVGAPCPLNLSLDFPVHCDPPTPCCVLLDNGVSAIPAPGGHAVTLAGRSYDREVVKSKLRLIQGGLR